MRSLHFLARCRCFGAIFIFSLLGCLFISLINITAVRVPIIVQPSVYGAARAYPDILYFKSFLTSSEKKMQVSLLAAVLDLLGAANVTYFLYGGTLIGSWRYHDVIPWDDDLDLMVLFEHRTRLLTYMANDNKTAETFSTFALESAGKNGVIKIMFNSRDHFKCRPIKGRTTHCWPFVDIFFLMDYGDTVGDGDNRWANTIVLPKSIVFPLTYRPIVGRLAPAPCDTRSFLKHIYGDIGVCVSVTWNHILELYMPKETIKQMPCSRVNEHLDYAAVVRADLPNQLYSERLTLRGRVLSTQHVRNCREEAATTGHTMPYTTLRHAT